MTWQPAAGNTTPTVTIDSPTFGSVYAKGSAAINPLIRRTFTDPDNGPWTYTINWDDGSADEHRLADARAARRFQADARVPERGRLHDQRLRQGQRSVPAVAPQVWIVVYDPNGGFVTGGGWHQRRSRLRYTCATRRLSGRANFGFNSQYKKNANVPTGETEFNFQVGNMNFHSTEYQLARRLRLQGPVQGHRHDQRQRQLQLHADCLRR